MTPTQPKCQAHKIPHLSTTFSELHWFCSCSLFFQNATIPSPTLYFYSINLFNVKAILHIFPNNPIQHALASTVLPQYFASLSQTSSSSRILRVTKHNGWNNRTVLFKFQGKISGKQEKIQFFIVVDYKISIRFSKVNLFLIHFGSEYTKFFK